VCAAGGFKGAIEGFLSFGVLNLSSQIVKKEKTMAEEKEKRIEIGQEPQSQAPKVEGELSESDIEKVSGGCCPQFGYPTNWNK
jgi:hypothetical protein